MKLLAIIVNHRRPELVEKGLVSLEPELRALGRCEVHEGKAILAVVGQNLAKGPGLGARILEAIAAAGVSVEMISYALDSINFAMIIDDSDIARCVSLLHRVLFVDGPGPKYPVSPISHQESLAEA